MTPHNITPSLGAAENYAAQDAQGERVTLKDLQASISQVRYLNLGKALDAPSNDHTNLMTLCILTTWAGYVVVGKSAAMDPGNFNAEKGKTFAYEDALRQLWPLHAFHRLEARGASL